MHTLAISLTDNCPLRCSFCCVPPKPLDLKDSFLFDVLKTAESRKFKKVGFTGGEPLIRRKKLFEAVRLCNDSGIPWGLTTGLGWTKKEEYAITVANELVSNRINDITISIDPSHLKFTDQKIYIVFIRELLMHNIPILLSVTLFKNERQEFEKYLSKNILSKLIDSNTSLIKVDFHYVAQVGYAENKEGCGSIIKEKITSKAMRCPLKKSFVFSVWPNGDVYPCCSTYIVNKKNELILGNLKENSFEEIIDFAENDPYLWALSNLGFNKIISFIKDDIDFSEILNSKFNDVCDLCNTIGTKTKNITIKQIRNSLYQNAVK
ncbi:radical SAM protein [Aquimarina algiphila]|uniref:radical SAM protein n=1 Tax=Aquimarina algiphila TaxID=2047982 RepID=UPI00249278A8|nr:radical SAM protein [Aquimarina algiphila]